jgi:hypothetical protein
MEECAALIFAFFIRFACFAMLRRRRESADVLMDLKI